LIASIAVEIRARGAVGRGAALIAVTNRSVTLAIASVRAFSSRKGTIYQRPCNLGWHAVHATHRSAMEFIRVALLFAITALAEIVGCYLPWLVLRQGKSPLLLVPGVLSLMAFAWLLTFHPASAGRTYAAYGGMYIAVALVWLRVVEGVPLTRWDVAGAAIALAGMAVIALQPAPG
jgi:small multidrug resistance family-3 protein